MNTINEVIIKYATEADASWGGAYGLFARIINRNHLKIGVELGVAFGGHSEALLKNTEVSRLYGIDPYRHFDEYDDPMNLPQDEFDELYLYTLNRLKPFGDRYIHIRKTSDSAISDIPNEIDFVYIDADHSYEGVARDLGLWFMKVKDGGIIGGHDYDHSSFPGVKKAVDEFFRRLGSEIHLEGEGVWWTIKQMPNISFIMPAYNCATTVAESAESIMKTNLIQGDELVITNDCSTDNTKEVLLKLQGKYPDRIIILNHSINKGGAAARNTAVEHASNQLIFCLDSDNVLAPDSIQKLKKFFITSMADVASFGELHYFKEDTKKITHTWIFQKTLVLLADVLSNPVVPGSSGYYLFTKESWIRAGRYPEFAGALDAWGFGFRQVATGSRMLALPGSFYYHRCGHESYWMRDSKKPGLVSLVALQIVIPFIDRFYDRDVNYIMSKRGRRTWYNSIVKHPIRVKKDPSADLFAKNGIKKIAKKVYHKVRSMH